MEWAPCVRAEVVNEAEPFERVLVPNTVVPSRNCTVPVALAGVMVARNDTALPRRAGFRVEVSVVVVASKVTFSTHALDSPLKYQALPLSSAMSDGVPGRRFADQA